tara:strand:- start:459 stop:782 length:324 start_codon:yes stop_codon:yes gene_type:complete
MALVSSTSIIQLPKPSTTRSLLNREVVDTNMRRLETPNQFIKLFNPLTDSSKVTRKMMTASTIKRSMARTLTDTTSTHSFTVESSLFRTTLKRMLQEVQTASLPFST